MSITSSTRVNAAMHRRKAGPSAEQLWDTPYLCPPPLTYSDQIRHSNTYGREVCFMGPAPIHRSGAPEFLNLGFPCLCLHPLALNDQIRRDNTASFDNTYRDLF